MTHHEQGTQDELERTRLALVDQLGGRRVYEMAELHFGEGHSLATVAAWFDTPVSTVHRQVTKMRAVFMAYGIPERRWTRQKPGRAAGRMVQHFGDFPEKVG